MSFLRPFRLLHPAFSPAHPSFLSYFYLVLLLPLRLFLSLLTFPTSLLTSVVQFLRIVVCCWNCDRNSTLRLSSAKTILPSCWRIRSALVAIVFVCSPVSAPK